MQSRRLIQKLRHKLGPSYPLVRAAIRSRRAIDAPERELLRDLDNVLAGRHAPQIAVLADGTPGPLGSLLTAAYRNASLFTLDSRLPTSDLHADLAAHGRYDLIIDETRRPRDRKRLMRNAWFHLRRGGSYVVADIRSRKGPQRPPDAVLWPYLVQLIGRRAEPGPEGAPWRTRDERNRAAALGRVILGSRHLIATNRTKAYPKLRETEMNRAIAARANDGAVLLRTLPPTSLESRAVMWPENTVQENYRLHETYETPELSVRRYRPATLVPEQVVIHHNLIVPDSFRHNQYSRLKNHRISDLTHYFATVEDRGPVQHLPGRYFYLDSAFPGHYGHLLTEPVSRLWAWPELKDRYPDLKAVLTIREEEPRAYEVELYRAAGIDPSDLVGIRQTTKVDELYGATPMASMPSYIHPEIAGLWQRIGDRLAERAPDRDYPERIFVTRRPGTKRRPCHNQDEVEDWFTRSGFAVIRPERMPLPEQVQTFRRASLIAGFGGSGLFTMMFRPGPVSLIMLRPRSYTSVNEYMIGSVLGNRIYQFDAEPDIDHPDGTWSRDAFYSGFRFDLDAVEPQLKRILDSI